MSAVNDARFAHIGLPAGAVADSRWSQYGKGLYARCVVWWAGRGKCSTVAIYGEQFSDGKTTMPIEVTLDNDDMFTLPTAAEAREVAALLLQAADRLDVLLGTASTRTT